MSVLGTGTRRDGLTGAGRAGRGAAATVVGLPALDRTWNTPEPSGTRGGPRIDMLPPVRKDLDPRDPDAPS
jgi:hypothetical protein